jgi:hypothetical protein
VTCLNCGQPTGPRFCGHCGQAIDDRRSPLVALVRDVLEEALAIDGRALRTLRALVHPGALTRHYLDGRRVRFLTPFRLYLTASVLVFSSLLALDPPDADQVNLYVAGESVTGPEVRGRPYIRIVEPNDRLAQWAITRYRDKFAELRRRPPQELVNRLFGQLRGVLPGAFILFVPVLALALKVLYLRRRVLYVDHLIFGVHFQSALFLVLVATWLVLRALSLPLFVSAVIYLGVFFLMLTVYLARSLRRVYAQSWPITALKTAALVLAYFMLIQPVLGAAVFLVLWRL